MQTDAVAILLVLAVLSLILICICIAVCVWKTKKDESNLNIGHIISNIPQPDGDDNSEKQHDPQTSVKTAGKQTDLGTGFCGRHTGRPNPQKTISVLIEKPTDKSDLWKPQSVKSVRRSYHREDSLLWKQICNKYGSKTADFSY